MAYCYSAIDSPSFFYAAGDCSTTNHDLRIVSGDLEGGEDSNSGLLSAILIQLNTDRRASGERGWWGDEFNGFPLGNTLWTLAGKPATEAGISAEVDQRIREALAPILQAGLIDEATVRTVRTISGTEVTLIIKRGGSTLMEATFNG